MHQQLPAIRVDQLFEGFLIAGAGRVEVGGFIEIHDDYILPLSHDAWTVNYLSLDYHPKYNTPYKLVNHPRADSCPAKQHPCRKFKFIHREAREERKASFFLGVLCTLRG